MGNSVLFDVSNNIATIRINRPEYANALDIAVAKELAEAAIACDSDPGIRASILTGVGDSFCVGGDLKAFRSAETRTPRYVQQVVVNLHAAMSHFMRMDAPLVVAVNGRTGGAGVSIALAGDYIIAAGSASFVLGYTAVGLVPDGGSTYTLPRRIGWPLARELMLTNRRVDAEEAERIGLVDAVVDDAELEDRTRQVAEKFAEGPTEVFGATKRLLLNRGSESLETQMELEAREIIKSAGHRNAHEGIAAFLDRRPARFHVEE